MQQRDGQPRRRSLGYSEDGARLNVSFGDDEVRPAEATRQPISPGWLARDRAKQAQIAREKQRSRSPPDSIAVRARAVNNRIGIRGTDSARLARASPRSRGDRALARPSSSPRVASPRSPRTAMPTSAADYGTLASARPWLSQRSAGRRTEDLWRRSSATEYVRSLQSLSDTLNHPQPLVQVTARRSIDSFVQKERANGAAAVTGRLSAAEFVKKLQDQGARGTSASRPPWREPRYEAETAPKADPSIPIPEPELMPELHTPPRDTGPVTVNTASSFSEWYAANRSGASPSSNTPAKSPTVQTPEPKPRSDTGRQLLLQPASPSPSKMAAHPPHTDHIHSSSNTSTRAPAGDVEVAREVATSTVPYYSVMQHRSYGGSTPVASPRTVERRQRVKALASAARR